MPVPAIFAVPLGNPLAQRRKRKREDEEEEEEDHDDEQHPGGEVSHGGAVTPKHVSAAVAAITSLTAERAREYRTAGFDPEDDLPVYPFPHKPLPPTKDNTSKTIAQELAGLKPPLRQYSSSVADRLSSADSAREDYTHHLAAVTAILHQSLLRGESQRAERAWHRLLSSGPEHEELRRTAMDLRPRGRWAIGAEILLRRANRDNRDPSAAPSDEEQQRASSRTPALPAANLRAAREYYERLAVQYPPHISRAEKPTDFYLAALTLWIREITQHARAERARLEAERDAAVAAEAEADDAASDSAPQIAAFHERLDALRRHTLRAASDVAARLDEIRVSPPLDRSAELLRLRAMLALWIADLLVPEHWPPDGDGPAERVQRQRERVRELLLARNLFAKAEAKGAGMGWSGVDMADVQGADEGVDGVDDDEDAG